MTKEELSDNFLKVRESIRQAEKASGRKEGCVKLCAVSKFHPLESVLGAMECGQFLFGENRVQEACEKFSQIKDERCSLHIIGSLQSNKVKKAVEIASCIQSVDRENLLAEIEKQCSKLGRTIQVLFELHTGEDSKSGYPDTDLLFKSLENCASGLYPHIVPRGFMTMAPFTDQEKAVRESFSSLREVSARARVQFPELSLEELSMGMSGDYRIAIEEGSTMVRIGTALFGSRS